MPEPPVDVYADQLGVNMGPFGCVLNFSVSNALPAHPGVAIQGQPVASIRMSLEHLKMMAFLLRRQMLEYERQSGVTISIPHDVLNQLRIGREDWDECWSGEHR